MNPLYTTAVHDLNDLPLPMLFEALIADGSLDRLLVAACQEDLAEAGDVTTAAMINDGWEVRAAGITRDEGVVSGIEAVPRVLAAFGGDADARFERLTADGSRCAPGQTIFKIHGPITSILTAERTLLNIVGRLSGIATLTALFVDQVAGTGSVICDTRKTTPAMRSLEKYAVRCGGGTVHRMGLHDAVLIKDNHLAHLGPTEVAPAVTRAVTAARRSHELRFVEVEVDDLDQLRLILGLDDDLIDIVLLDNMTLEQLREAVTIRDAENPRVALEASGGISLDDVRAVAETGVQRISVGALTHGATSLDVSLDVT